jgi:sugar phosphate isomerase/epimerase
VKISLSMWSVHQYWYNNTWETVDFIEFASTTKAEGVELLSCFWRDKETEIPKIQAALERTGLPVACFCACNNFGKMNEDDWKAELKDVTDAVDMAVLFGAKVVRVFSGDKVGDVTFEQAKSQIIRGLKESAEYAEWRGITLCLENHGLFAGKADQVVEIIREVDSPALRSTFDTGNFLLVGEDPDEAIVKLRDDIKHVHFKDFLKVENSNEGQTYQALNGDKFVGKIAGQGQVNLTNILAELKKSGYDGWLTVEFEGEEEPKYGSIESINNLAEILKEL